MNQQRLDELKQRAERATQIAADIERLTEADPYFHNARMTFTDFNTGTSYLDGDFLKKIVAEGRRKVLADLEAELESLLASDDRQQPTEGGAITISPTCRICDQEVYHPLHIPGQGKTHDFEPTETDHADR